MKKKEVLQKIKYLLKFVPDKIYLKVYYRLRFHSKLNLKNPKTFNEKIQWLKLNDRNPEYIKIVDKYEVRKIIKEKIGGEYLVPIYGVWDTFEQIDFEKLPEKFVLKCTHDSGGVVICKNKNDLDKEKAKKKIEKCLKNNFYYIAREWPYKKVKPRIICEQYLEDSQNKELIDYKIMCFNGNPKCLFVCIDRESNSGLKLNFYDLDWNKLPFKRRYPNFDRKIQKPKQFDKMLELAKKLSKDIPFVRVDFYEVNEKIYFGELTLFPGGGFEEFTPSKYDEELGSWINLKAIN